MKRINSTPQPSRFKHARWREGKLPQSSRLQRLREVRWEVGLAGLAIAVVAAVAVKVMFLVHIFTFIWAGKPILASFAALWGRARYKRSHSHVRSLMDFPVQVTQFPVRIEAFRQSSRIKYGCDEGLISFVDEYLVYEGIQTSFSLARRDVLLKLENSSSLHFKLYLPESITLRVTPFDKVPGVEHYYRSKFRFALSEYSKRSPLANFSSVLPPIEVQPDLVRQQALVQHLCFGFVGLLIAAAIGVALYGSTWFTLPIALTALLAWLRGRSTSEWLEFEREYIVQSIVNLLSAQELERRPELG